MKKLQKYLPGTVEKSYLLTKLATDTLNWSKPNYVFRVRLVKEHLTRTIVYDIINPDFYSILQSGTKARRFHGYLEGDYELATAGFYTNNARGIARLVKKYPDMIESIQSYDQYTFAEHMANYFYKKGNEKPDHKKVD